MNLASLRQSSFSIIALGIVTGFGLTVWSQTPTPAQPVAKTAVEGKDGWGQIDQRLVFLTVELSTVESSIAATNKALKANGYKLADLTSDAEKARQRNTQMDRQGGGPVPWQQFYGRTARDFFYHPNDDNSVTVYVNPAPVDQRPPQFDYIYRANEDNRAKAEAAAADVGNKIDDLLAHRKILESEQLALWCKISFRGVASKELETKPLYRFDLLNAAGDDKQRLAAIKAGVEFVRAVNTAIAHAPPAVESDQKSALDDLLRATTAARIDVDGQLLQLPGIAMDLADPKSPIGQFRHATRQMQDFAENMVDAFHTSTAAEVDSDPGRKSISRGQFQQAIFSYCEALLATDASLSSAAKAWSVGPDLKSLPAAGDRPPAAAGTDSIASRLQTAKSQSQAELTRARQVLVSAISGRMDAAADAGDLGKVQSLQLAKASAARDGSIPTDVADPTVVAAKSSYDTAVRSANEHLASAYKTAIRDFTRARQFTEAQAAQDEFAASGLATSAAGAEPTSPGGNAPGSATSGEANVKLGPLLRLGRSLPSFLVGQEFSADNEGVQLTSALQTRANDVLTKDFIFDVEWDRKEQGEEVFVGLADGEKTTAIKIYPTKKANGYVTLTNNDSNGVDIGHLPEPGKCIIRVEKIGRTVIFSVGTMDGETFAPQLAREVIDIQKFNEELHEKSTHLFVMGKSDTFTRTRLAMGPNTVSNQSRKEIPLGSFELRKLVPSFLTGTVCDVRPEGLVTHGQRMESVSPAVLTKDFSCDVTFVTHKETTAWIGLGETGDGDRPEKFAGLCVRSGRDGHTSFSFDHNGDSHKEIGSISEPGSYVARITKQGQEITFAVGSGEGKAFKPIASRTVSDMSSFDTDLNAGNTHLFLGGNIAYSKITISASVPVAPAEETSAPAAHPAIDPLPAKPDPVAPLAGATPTKLVFDGKYWIVNKKTGLYLFVNDGNKNQGNVASARKKNTSDGEQWSLNTPVGSDGVKLVNKFSNRSISVRAGNKAEGADFIQWNEWKAGEAYNKVSDDNWKVEKVGDDYKFVNELTGLVMTMGLGKDRKITQQTWKATDEQLWRLDPVK